MLPTILNHYHSGKSETHKIIKMDHFWGKGGKIYFPLSYFSYKMLALEKLSHSGLLSTKSWILYILLLAQIYLQLATLLMKCFDINKKHYPTVGTYWVISIAQVSYLNSQLKILVYTCMCLLIYISMYF